MVSSFTHNWMKPVKDDITVDEAIQCLKMQIGWPPNDKKRVIVPTEEGMLLLDLNSPGTLPFVVLGCGGYHYSEKCSLLAYLFILEYDWKSNIRLVRCDIQFHAGVTYIGLGRSFVGKGQQCWCIVIPQCVRQSLKFGVKHGLKLSNWYLWVVQGPVACYW